jgi:hypothetical protein
VIALLRYQAAILLRSHRWVLPVILYGLLLSVGFASSTPLSQGLDWSAGMLVPAVALLTRSMLTAEPDAARACVCAAVGPVRAQLAVLLSALGAGAVLGIAGACFEVVTDQSVVNNGVAGPAGRLEATTGHPGVLFAGFAMAAVCLLVGSAVGALCNPPLLRHTGMALLATMAAVVFALASDISPAGAALRYRQATSQTAHWPGLAPFVASACLLVVIWSASVFAAGRRDSGSPAS